MLLVWHAALGCDDEQATEAERAARLLYAHASGVTEDADAAQARGLHALQFMEALTAFTRLLRRRPSPGSATADPEWVSVTLATRRFFIREVEPQIFFALGVETAELCGNELRTAHGAVLAQLYDAVRLFYGRVDRQLRALPPYLATRFEDGMALLAHIAALRRRLRKIAIAQELEDHDKREAGHDKADAATQDEEAEELAREVETLEASSPSRVLWKRFDALVPILLLLMETSRLSMFHEVDGVAYFPMEEATFLALQTLVNSLLSDLGGLIQGGLAVFYRGNVLWRTMEAPTLVTLQRFLRLREQHGMDVTSSGRHTDPMDSLWMRQKYDDAFSPVWASKTTYAECAVVTHIAPHPRRTSRSLHKQAPSSMSTLVNDLMDTIGSATATAEQQLIRRGQRYRSDAPVYRNRGFLSVSGYFLPSWELAKPDTHDEVWAPSVFPFQEDESLGASTALLYHENDLSLLLFTKPSTNTAATLQHMERIEDCLEKLQFAEMATTIWKRYLAMTGSTQSREKPSSTAQPPYVYLNRVNLAFKGSDQIPRLLKTKEPDLYPRPAALWPHYFPVASLAVLNDAHESLNSDAEAVELRVKTVHDGWLVSQRSRASDRELYALFDTKAASVADAQDATNDLLAAQFSNIFL